MKNSLTNNTLRDMKNYMRYISLFLMIVGMSIGNAWGAFPTGYTSITSIASLSTGDYVVLVNNNSSAGVSGWDGSNDLTTSATESEWVQFRVTKSSNYIKLYDPAAGAYLSHTGASSNLAKYGASVDELSIDEASNHTQGKLRLKDEISSKVYYLQHKSDYVRFYGSSQSAYYMVYKVNSPDPADPVYITINTPITIDAGTFNGSDINGTTGSYTLSFTFNSCGYDWYFENYKDYYETSDDEALLQIKKSNGSAYSSNQYHRYHDPDDCSPETETVTFDYSVYTAGTHTGNLIFYGYNSSTYDAQYAIIPFTITATAGCTSNATVTAVTSSSVSQSNATVSCASGISSLGSAGCSITSYGFVYSVKATNATPTIGGSGVTPQQVGTSYASTGTAFNRELTGLTSSTTYCVRAYATNGNGTAYSSVHEFTTDAEPTFGNYVITCDDYHTVTYNKNTTADITGSLPTDANEYTTGQTVYVSDGTIGRTGYEFVGWNTDNEASVGLTQFTMGAEDAVLYAVWSPIDYTLTMATSVGGGAGTTTSDAAITSPRTGAGTVTSKHYGEEITVTVVAPAHHTFTGWTSSNGGSFANASAASTTFTMPAGNTTVTASFTEDTKYAVTWDDNGDTNVEYVYSGETTTYPALANGCELYVAAGWSTSDFNAESLNKPASFWAVGATTPTITAAVTYKAVYRHKYYTEAAFVNGTTDGEAYYLYATYSGNNHYKTTYNGSDGFTTSTSKGSAVPVYLEKVGGSYYIRDVVTDNYYYGNSGTLKANDSKSATDAYKWTFSTGLCEPSRGDYKVVNEADKGSKTLLLNSSGDYIKEYGQTGDCPAANYYHLNLEPAYYYKYSPTAACYDITITKNANDRGVVSPVNGSNKLVGNVLTVTPNCGYAISSITISPESTSAEYTSRTEGRSTIYTIIPKENCTFRVNFTTESDDYKYTISYVDGATTLAQTKTDADKACGSVTLPDGYNTEDGAGDECDGWTFDGWTQTEYTFGQLSEPSDIEDAGSSQTVSGDQTWYAVYHKTFAAGDYFYLMYGANYVTSFNSSAHKFVANETTTTNALLFAMENNYLYYLDPSTRRKMWVYADGNTVDVTATETKPSSTAYQTTMTLVSGTYQITNGNNRYLSASGTDVKYYSGTSNTHATKPDASSFIAYYPKTDCAVETATITFNPGAGNTCALSTVVAEIGSTISLPVAADVSGYDADWTFYGWSPTEVTNIGTAAPGILYTGGASYTVTADATLYAIYTQTPPDGNFDNTSGGKYKIWAIKNGIYYYATSNGMTRGKLGVTTDCSEGALFELIRNDVTGGYKIHINGENKYLKGAGNDDTDFDYVLYASAPEWTITDVHSTSPNGYWRISSGIQSRGIVFGHTNFGHYDATQIANSPTMWFDVYIGQCNDDYYTSNPNKSLSLTGDIRITSTNGQSVRSASSIAVKGSLLSGSTISASSSNSHFAATFASNVITDGGVNTTMTVTYTPAEYATTESAIITVTAEDKSQQIEVYGRSLPQNFAIVVKAGGKWYALPNTCTEGGTPAGLPVEVDDDDMPTAVSLAPHDIEFGLSDIVNTRWPANQHKVWLYEQKSGVSKAFYDGTSANIQVYAQLSTLNGSSSESYDWILHSEDLKTYTIQNGGTTSHYLNINNALNFGTHSQSVASNELFLLPISAYYTLVDASIMEWGTDHLVISMATPPATATKLKVKVGESLGSEQTLASTKKDEGIYRLSVTLSSSDALKEMMLLFFNSSDVEVGRTILTVPMLVSATDATTGAFADAVQTNSSFCDIVVLPNAKLTVSEESASKVTYRDLYIYGDGKMVVPADKYIGFASVIMRGGHLNSSWEYQYSRPQLVLNGYMSISVGKIYYDYLTNNAQFYSLALPYRVQLQDIVNPYFNNKRSWEIHAYDGAKRASGSQVSGWYDVEVGSTGANTGNISALTSTDYLTAGVGYTFWGAMQKVNSVRQKWSVNRFRMTVAGNAPEATKNAVAVIAHGMTDGEPSEGVSPNNAGWNMLGNPFLADIDGSAALESGELVQGKVISWHNEKIIENGQWTGQWELVANETSVRYVRIPSDNGEEYTQTRFKDATIKAFHHFFIQVAEDGDFQIAVSNRVQSAPARKQRNGQVLPDEMDIDLLLINGESQTSFGLTVNDEFSPTFKVGEDMPEDLAGATMKAYTLVGTERVTYNGLPYQNAGELIPVGYRAQTNGEYTFSYAGNMYDEYIEHIWLTDYEAPQMVIDLKEEPYTFTTESGVFDNRFVLNVVFKTREVTTDFEEIDSGQETPQKFIYRDKLYILRRGVIYDSTGKKVREINK